MKHESINNDGEMLTLVPLTKTELQLLIRAVSGVRTLSGNDPRIDPPYADLQLYLETLYNCTPWFK